MNILLIDDDRMTLKALRLSLVQKGYNVRLASNKQNALKQMREEEIDCIVSDVNLPDTTLPDLFFALREVYDRHVPTILISTQVNNPVIDDTLIAGADAFIPKPVDRDLLHDVIQRVAVFSMKS